MRKREKIYLTKNKDLNSRFFLCSTFNVVQWNVKLNGQVNVNKQK